MTERRCPHGFMLSRVSCPTCGQSKRRRPGMSSSAWLPKTTAIASLPFPMSCRFCRRGCHDIRHVTACPKYWRFMRYEALRERQEARREALERIAC